MSTASVALELMELLYDAPGSPEKWRSFLGALCEQLSGDVTATLAGMPRDGRSGILVSHGLDDVADEVTDAVTRPRLQEPEGVSAVPVGTVVSIPEGFFAKRFAESQLYRVVLEPTGVSPSGAVAVVLDRSSDRAHTFLLVLGRDGWSHSEQDRALLEMLAPHLVRAARLHDRLRTQDITSDALLSALHRLVLGVLLVDQQGQVVFANRSGAALLGGPPGLTEPALLGTDRDHRTQALRRWIGREEGPRPGASIYPHPSDGRPLQVLTVPSFWERQDGETTRRIVVAVFIGDPERHVSEPIQILRDLYHLTPAESRLAIGLLSDQSVEQAARELGVTVGTARTTLKRVFVKTGTNRQASLVRLLLTGPGLLLPNQPSEP